MKRATFKDNLIFFTLIIMSITAFILVRLDGLDLDMLWHYRIGQDIFLNHEVSTENPYSWISGTKWTQQEWLFDVLFYLINSVFGIAGIYVSYILIFTALLHFSIKINRINIRSEIYYVYFVLIMFITIPTGNIMRPAHYSTIFLPILVYYFDSKNIKNIWYLFLISGIFLSNFHCGQGMAILVILLLDLIIDLFISFMLKQKPVIAIKVKYLLLFLMGLFINPLGPKQIISLFQVKSMETTSYLNEWKSLDLSNYPVLIICAFFLFVFGYTFATSRDKKDLIHMLLTMAALIYTMYCIKSSIIFLYLAVTFNYTEIKTLFTNIINKMVNKKINIQMNELSLKTIIIAYILAAILGIAILTLENGTTFVMYVNNQQESVIEEKTIQYLKSNCKENLFHSYNIANYLLWNNIPVFVDSRQFPYENAYEVTSSCNDILKLTYNSNNKEDIDRIMNNYKIEYVLYDQSLNNMKWYFSNNEEYQVLLKDKYGNIIYKRNN